MKSHFVEMPLIIIIIIIIIYITITVIVDVIVACTVILWHFDLSDSSFSIFELWIENM